MTVIDVHTHILPKTWPNLAEKFGYGDFVHLEHVNTHSAKMMLNHRCFRTIQSNCYDLAHRLEECDAHGVDKQVLSTVPIMFSYWAKPKDTLYIAQFLNDHIAECVAQYPDRFIGLGTLPMQDTELAIQELERIMHDLKLHGIQIGSHINDQNLNHAALYPIFQAASELGAAIFVHPWDMMAKSDMPEYWLPWLVGMPAETARAICYLIFGGVIERLPELRIAFAHGGGSFIPTIGRICHGHKVRPDLCAVDNAHSPEKYIKQLYFDCLVHDKAALQLLIEKVGCDKVMLGTDYPFPLGEANPGELLRSLSLSPDALNKTLSQTAKSWLGMGPS